MKLLITISLIVSIFLIQTVTTAPTSKENITEEPKKETLVKETDEVIIDLCETEGLDSLLECTVDDQECESKNEQKRLKRQTICSENPQCNFCNVSQPIEIPHLDESFIVEPEIDVTLRPPPELNNDSIPIDETIVVDGNVEQVIGENQATTDATKPLKLIERNIVLENDNEKHFYRGYVDPSSNVTTIIRLTNSINNHINMPTTLNNTNINNIHVYNNKTSKTGGKYGLGYTEDGPCCFAMKPGLCKKTTAGLKCRHKKTRMCGRQCTKKMIHSQRSFCNQIPYWPYMVCPPPPQFPFNPQYPAPQFPPSFEDEFDDDDDLPLFPTDEELENPESDWVVFQEKCKIVSEDGLHISNCTEKNADFEHPYARNSVDNTGKRNPRHAKKGYQNFPPQQIQQQQPFYPYGYPMMQPMYFQPIPVYMPMPQYYPYQQPNMNTYYPQQMPLPPIDTENYYNDESIIIREINPYKNSRKHLKKHPIVIEHDDEL